jgi:DNA-binding transcriptional ArsR family regulator
MIAIANRATEDGPPVPDAVSLETASRSLALHLLGQAILHDVEAFRVQVADGTVRVAVSVWRETAGRQPVTDCERDVLTVLTDATFRLTTNRVLEELDRRGCLHGQATVSRTLARLVRAGILDARRRSPRGYLLAERLRDGKGGQP